MTKISAPLRVGAAPPRTPWQEFRKDPVTSIIRWLYSTRPSYLPNERRSSRSLADHIELVCISDTHNTQPSVPDGDVLLHAGDLTNSGTFSELQAQLTWLASLPHRHKIVIAGNHDRLLDRDFVEHHPERIRETPGQSRSDLNWHDIVYLQNSSVTISISTDRMENHKLTSSIVNNENADATTVANHSERTLKIYGSPQTPLCGTFAFQYPPIRDVWRKRIPDDTDIVLVHGPPKGFLDRPIDDSGREMDNKGCPHLVSELKRVQPRAVVFGHIHSGHGREQVRWKQQLVDGAFVKRMGVAEGEKMSASMGWLLVVGMVFGLGIAWMAWIFELGTSRTRADSKGATAMVNAAIGEDAHQCGRTAVVVEI